MEQLKLNNEKLQTLMEVIKKDIKSADKELEKIDVKDITLDDLIIFKSKMQITIQASKSIGLLYPIAENYFLANETVKSMEQIKDRYGADNDISLQIDVEGTAHIEDRINNINSILESNDYKDVIDNYNFFNSIQAMKDENDDEQSDAAE